MLDLTPHKNDLQSSLVVLLHSLSNITIRASLCTRARSLSLLAKKMTPLFSVCLTEQSLSVSLSSGPLHTRPKTYLKRTPRCVSHANLSSLLACLQSVYFYSFFVSPLIASITTKSSHDYLIRDLIHTHTNSTLTQTSPHTTSVLGTTLTPSHP